MKSAIKTVALAIAFVVPAVSFAQPSNAPLTSAQVRAQLIQLEQAGYKPSKTKYPADIQAAEARVATGNDMTEAASTGLGGTVSGASQSGHRLPASNDWNSLYSHH